MRTPSFLVPLFSSLSEENILDDLVEQELLKYLKRKYATEFSKDLANKKAYLKQKIIFYENSMKATIT